jgi:hypothetical protein
VTLRNDWYARQWRVDDAARNAGLRLDSVVGFRPEQYPGYHHVTTKSTAGRPDVSQGVTFIFVRD